MTRLEGDELGVAQVLDISEAYLSKKFTGVASKLVSTVCVYGYTNKLVCDLSV